MAIEPRFPGLTRGSHNHRGARWSTQKLLTSMVHMWRILPNGKTTSGCAKFSRQRTTEHGKRKPEGRASVSSRHGRLIYRADRSDQISSFARPSLAGSSRSIINEDMAIMAIMGISTRTERKQRC